MGNSENKKARGNIYVTYFILFASIFLVTFVALGTSLIFLVDNYSVNEKTNLLKENTQELADIISRNLIANDMNSSYTAEKASICNSLNVVSRCIDSDIFVCDTSGNIIMCKDQIGSIPRQTKTLVCEDHQITMSDLLIQSVYESEGDTSVTTTTIEGKSCYVVGTAIRALPKTNDAQGEIIGTVFAIVENGTAQIVSAIIRMFTMVALICMGVGFIMIWMLTKRMVTPLQQMSIAANRFAVGDFSYRVNVSGNDELADLGTAFNDMADALDKLESSRRSFVANVSHELKTPMTSIAGFIDGILDGTIPREKQDYYLKLVSDEVRRLSRLVVAMLNMSKMESGDFEMNPKNYNISDQIVQILLTFEQKIETKHVEILGLDHMKPHRVHADPDMIYQVIYNLFDNAVKFTNIGGYIGVDITELDEKVQITIKNSGEGIKSYELPHLFERFYKVDKSRSLDASGAGLGLYIVKMMVEMNGGKIRAQSNSSSTAEFIFTLPKE
ncbi:MAG: HAMP domain-containing histidine kinase [Eubacterium sp.]|nr:HAMP domain-containing histidine kinase [Eubacterium sp.]